MRKLLLLFVISLFLPLSSVFSQTFEDYVLEFRGDTAVIKDFFDFTPNEKNTLYQALTLDASPPAGRVYMLKTTGYYPLTNNPTTLRATIIVGEDPTIMVNNTNSAFPPLICGALIEGQDPNTGGINFAHNLTVKNCNIIPAAAAGALGWNFFDCQAADVRLTLQNNLFERTRWVFMASGQENVKFYIKDNYFVNMNGQACRRNGGVLDEFARQDTLWVENNTHVMAQGLIYKFRSNQFNRIVFNHNTFVNMGNLVFLDLGSQSQMSVTNNMFINCNIQPYVGAGHTIDDGEEDKEHLPIGITNFYPDTAVHVDRKYLVHKNLIYWDSRFDDMVDILNNNQVNNSTDWVSQMITMNTRTQAAFDNNATYPYLTEGDWIEAVPTFTNSEDLLTTQVDNLKAFGLATLDTNDVTTT